MTDNVVVRRAALADQPAIERFIAQVYGPEAKFKGRDRWEWQFVRNRDLGTGADETVPVWIAVDGANVVGQIAVQGSSVKVGASTHTGGWIVDVMVSPTHRGSGLGHRLYSAVARDVPLLLTLTMAPATRRMAERLDAVTLGPTDQFSLWRRLEADDVRRYLRQRLAERPRLAGISAALCRYLSFDRIFALAWNLSPSFRRAPRTEELSITEVGMFGNEVDGLWRAAANEQAAICERTSAWLNWRLVDCPTLRYRLFLARRAETVVGYVVLRRCESEELRQGIIVDVFASRRDQAALTGIVAFAVDHFGDDVASIECGASSPELRKVLRRAGFAITRRHYPTVVASDPDLRREVERLKADWFFSKVDHDWDQVHPAG